MHPWTEKKKEKKALNKIQGRMNKRKIESKRRIDLETHTFP